jgi:diadenosine tetraphosphatase ApaH/serine/threonine PP2A family protein phosphatase
MRHLIISDIHANLFALQAVLKDCEGEYDDVWFLGDVVGYGPHPNECIERLVDLSCLAIAGNHDWATLGRLDADSFNPDARHVLLWTRSVLSKRNLQFLDELEVSIVREEHFTLVHGSPRHPIWEYILHPRVAQANFDHFATRYCLVGHTHSPVIFDEGGGNERMCEARFPAFNGGPQALPDSRLIINPGSVGQPRDGDPRASYGILNTGNLTFEPRRVSYPVAQTQALMGQLGFPARLIIRLAFGR